MHLLYLILNIAALILLIILLINIGRTFLKKKTPKVKKRNTFLVLLFFFAIIFAPLFLSENYITEPILDTTQKQLNYNTKYKNYLSINTIYFNRLLEDSSNLDLHFNYVFSLQQKIEKDSRHRQYDPSYLKGSFYSNRVLDYYNGYIKDTSQKGQDIGHLYTAQHLTDLSEYELALAHLNKIVDTTLKHYNYIRGKTLSRTNYYSYYEEAEYYLTKGIQDSITQSTNELARLYYYFRKRDQLNQLILVNEANKDVSTSFKRISFMRTASYFSYWKTIYKNEISGISYWGFLSSSLILLIWLFYLIKIDIYEPEKWKHILLTLLMSMVTIFLVYPLSDVLMDVVQYYPSGGPVYSFFHITISIGMIEELVKIIPVLILLKLTKAINEPFDYILYCSISALGFAFIENLSYIQESSLSNINARALTASVAHIVDTSTIGYGLMLAKYKYKSHSFLIFIAFFCLASLMHGFYDYWLMEDAVKGFEWITILFYIFSIHVWHIYANNTLNISTFYHPNVVINNDRLKVYLIFSLVSLLMISYLINGYTKGKLYADDYLINSILYFGYFILYIAFTLSNFSIIRGYLYPINIPLLFLIPRIKRNTNFSGLNIKIAPSSKYNFREKYASLKSILFTNATLQQRVVIDNNLEAYVTLIENPIAINGFLSDILIVIPHSKKKNLNEDGNILIHVYLVPDHKLLEEPILIKSDFEYAGWAISKKNS
jgi:RsiW-degrading membrane proteinase PrsW (M82 family)